MPVESAPLSTATLDAFNTLPFARAEEQLLALCGSQRWASTLSHKRPFTSFDHLQHDATNLWFLLDETDWLEAFACHPRIGQRTAEHTAERNTKRTSSRANAAFAVHSTAEQDLTQQTLSPSLELALVEGNHLYEQRFGFLYIVFASGRTAPDLLALLHQRLEHDRITELHEAARQQYGITSLRMQKWFEG